MGTIVNFLRTFGFYRSSSTVVPIITTLLLSGVVFFMGYARSLFLPREPRRGKKQGLLRVPTTKWVQRPAMTTPDLTILYVGSMRDSKHVEEA